MPKNEGFSLLEMLVGLALGLIVAGAATSTLVSLQTGQRRLQDLLEHRQNVALAPLILTRILAGAGNHREAQAGTTIAFQDGTLTARSDQSGPQGFPDGTLDDPYERVALRVREKHLQLQLAGGTFQPLLPDFTGLTLEGWNPPSLELALDSGRLIPFLRPPSSVNSRLNLKLLLWNYRAQLFPVSALEEDP